MKILLEVDSGDTRIGAVNDALDLARYGRNISLEYVLCGAISEGLAMEARKLGIECLKEGSLQISKKGLVGYFLNLCRWIWQLKRLRPDIVHINYSSWGPSLACAGKLLGLPIVARGGGTYHPRNLTYRWVDRYAANCREQATGLLHSPVGGRVVVVGDLINMERFERAHGTGALPGIKGEGVRLLFLGQLVERKGLDILVKAVSRLGDNFVLYLVGGDWDQCGYPQQVKQLISDLGLNHKVFTFNHRTDALSLLKECDIFVLPSLSEARPRSIIEAMLLGKCVVSTTTGGIPSLIDNGNNGILVPPGNAEELCRQLQTVVNDREKRDKIGNAARQHAENTFNIADTLERYKRLYTSIRGSS